MLLDAISALGLTFDSTIKAGDLLTSISVIVALVTFVYTRHRDRQIQIKEYADNVRSAAASTLSKTDRFLSIFDSFYDKIETSITEADELLMKDGDAVATRDFFWRRCYETRVGLIDVFSKEEIELAYAPLFGYQPEVYQLFLRCVSDALVESAECFGRFRDRSQESILAMQDEPRPFRSAQLGNILRDFLEGYKSEHHTRVAARLFDVRAFLLEVVTTSDERLARPGAAPNRLRHIGAESLRQPLSVGQPQEPPQAVPSRLADAGHCLRCGALLTLKRSRIGKSKPICSYCGTLTGDGSKTDP